MSSIDRDTVRSENALDLADENRLCSFYTVRPQDSCDIVGVYRIHVDHAMSKAPCSHEIDAFGHTVTCLGLCASFWSGHQTASDTRSLVNNGNAAASFDDANEQ